MYKNIVLLILTYCFFAILVAVAIVVATVFVIQKFWYHGNMTSHFSVFVTHDIERVNEQPASRAFLSLARSWCTGERLCKNGVTSLLNMRGMLLGYSFEPRPNSPALSTAPNDHRFIN